MSEKQKRILRFGILERIEHLVLILSFTTLGLTGLIQKYAFNSYSQSIITWLGGIEQTRVIHRIAATIFLLEAIYHLVIVGYKLYVKRKGATMLPGIKDGLDAYQWFGYNLGFVKQPPKMPRYNFMEKAEYWAMLWGLVLMGLTGLMLWNPIATTNLLPGEFIPAAKAAHGAEAVLAVLAIILWHFYHVHIKHWNWAMIRGSLSRHEMEVEHGQELEQLESGLLPPDPAPAEMRRRLALFVPVAAVVSVALVGLTIYFLTYETSAIETVPPIQEGPVFLEPTATPTPIPTPTATPEPAEAGGDAVSAYQPIWAGNVETMLAENCAGCHGDQGDFNVESYDDTLKAVQPGDPDASLIIEAQREGEHPGQLSNADLQVLEEWVSAGAPAE